VRDLAPTQIHVIVIMGVSGAGKTVVGKALSAATGWPFYEGDDYHSAASVEKMRHGIPLDDDDRRPWLNALHQLIADVLRRSERAIIACSALKAAYRTRLAEGTAPGAVRFVHLDVPMDVLCARLETRVGHFMPPELLASQLDTLEAPRDALWVDGTKPPAEIVARIRHELGIP